MRRWTLYRVFRFLTTAGVSELQPNQTRSGVSLRFLVTVAAVGLVIVAVIAVLT